MLRQYGHSSSLSRTEMSRSYEVAVNNNNNNIIIIIRQHKPDIIIQDNEKRTCILIGVAISGDSNVIRKKLKKF